MPAGMTEDNPAISMRIRGVHVGESSTEGYRAVSIATSRGDVECRLFEGESSAALVWLGGAGGGWESPARGLYPEMAKEFAAAGVSSLWIRYRHPGLLVESVLDAIAGVTLLGDRGDDAVGIVGYSFGGAVAIQAAAAAPVVRLVVGLATQSHGTEPVATLAPRCAVLLAHGLADTVIPPDAARLVHARAKEPKQLSLYELADHVLDRPAAEIRELIRRGVKRYVASAAAWPPVLPLSRRGDPV